MNTKKKRREELQLLREEALNAYLNMEDFEFDVNADALYRYYQDQYTQLGKKAMEDTMGQTASLTGGYGSSYSQTAGQQAYQGYMDQLGDVVPALYQLAYQKQQDKGDRLYQTYRIWSEMEQQAAQQEQWEREYALEQQKLSTQTQSEAADDWEMVTYPQNLGIDSGGSTNMEIEYDNGNVSNGNIKTIQRVLGLEETGQWTDGDKEKAGNLTADQAWAAYQKGELQNYKSVGLGSQGISSGNIRAMERLLGLKEDGHWSAEDSEAVGGLTKENAWKAYQKGLLRKRDIPVQIKTPTDGEIKSMERVLGLPEDGVWSEEDREAANGFSAATAWEAYKSGSLQRWKSKGFFEKGTTGSNVKTQADPGNTKKGEMVDYSALTKQEAQRAANIISWEYNRLSALLERYKELTRWEQSPEREKEIQKIAAIYGSVADLEARVKTLREQKYYLDNAVRFNYLSENDDFTALSRQDYTIVDRTYLAVNEPTKVKRWETGAYLTGMSSVYDLFNYDNLHYMDDNERATFNYIYAKEGEDAAKEYLDYLQYELNRRSAGFWNESAADITQRNPLNQVVASLLSTAFALTGGKGLTDATLQNIRNAATGDYKPVDYNRNPMLAAQLTDTIRNAVTQKMEDITWNEEKNPILSKIFSSKNAQNIYQWLVGALDIAVVEGLNKIHPSVGWIASGIMSDTTGTQVMLDAAENGDTDEKAIATGVVRGLLDVFYNFAKMGNPLKIDNKIMAGAVDLVISKLLDGVFGKLDFPEK